MTAKNVLLFFTLVFHSTCFAQVDLFFPLLEPGTRYNWKTIERSDNQLKQKIIDVCPSEFSVYREKREFGPTISNLLEDLHVLDLNNDGLNDIIFDGRSGGEGFEVSLFINDGGRFRKLLQQYQGITRLEFDHNVLKKVHIQDWGCCSEYLVTNYIYSVNENMEFKLVNEIKFFYDCELPQTFLKEPIKFRVMNDPYNLRLNPFIDDTSSSHGYEGTVLQGNIIGALKKGSIGYALAESTDNTGRIWWFVAFPKEVTISHSLFFDGDDPSTYRLGWISSRFVERLVAN